MIKALVTGGVGFIGSHLVDSLLEKGYQVRVLDNLHPQIHGSDNRLPDYFPDETEFVFGDIRDEQTVKYALRGVDIVFHLAAETGVGQSMYKAESYTRTNVVGTAALWDTIHAVGGVEKLVLASSRAVYGEGTYQCSNCGRVRPGWRSREDLLQGRWSFCCSLCDSNMQSVATSEDDSSFPISVYGITKLTQEQLCLTLGNSYHIPVTILRFFNVYGSRQALSNPYTGILATFLARLRSEKPILVYEDGKQLRDFVHVSDVVQACMLAAAHEGANFQVFNVASGQPSTILQLARTLLELYGKSGDGGSLQVTGQYRVGDIRDCYADISKIESLGYKSTVSLKEGLDEFLAWADTQMLVDQTDEAAAELASAGLLGQHRVSRK